MDKKDLRVGALKPPPVLERGKSEEAKMILAKLFTFELLSLNNAKMEQRKLLSEKKINFDEYRTTTTELAQNFQEKYSKALTDVKTELQQTGKFDKSRWESKSQPNLPTLDMFLRDLSLSDDEEYVETPKKIKDRQNRESIRRSQRSSFRGTRKRGYTTRF